jgi:O-antigen/teichoic acid export membrane protein
MADLVPQSVKTDRPTGSARRVLKYLAQSFAIYGSANFALRAFNFLLILIYAHYLRPSDYGIIYLAEIIASFLAILAGLSIDSALERMYFQHVQDPDALNSYLGSVIRFGFSWMALFIATTLVFGWWFQARLPLHAQVPFYPYIAMAMITATVLQGIQYRLAVYQVSGSRRSYVTLSFVLAFATAACCLYWVIVHHDGAIGMLRGKLFAALVTLVIAAWSMRSFLKARFQWRFVRESLSFSLPLIPHLVMASGLVVADRFILAHYRDLNEVGIYSLAYSLGMVMYLVTQSLSQAWLPTFFELAGHGNRKVLGDICSGLALFLAALACLGMLFSPLVVHVALDERYRAVERIVPLVIMGYLFHALFSLFDLSILHAKRTASVFAISLLALLSNLALNLSMVPRWGMYGAAWATTIAYAIEATGAYFLAQRFFALPYRAFEVLAGIVIAGGALWLTQSPLIVTGKRFLLVLAAAPALALLTFLGRHAFRSTVVLMQNRGAPGASA